jgi:hypothetical protein
MARATRAFTNRFQASEQWAGEDSNLRLTDYESAALTAELPARRAPQRPGVHASSAPSGFRRRAVGAAAPARRRLRAAAG